MLAKGADEDAWLGIAFVLLLVPVTLIDLDHRIIPNKLMLVGTVVSIAIVLLTQPDSLTEHLIAAAGAGGFLLIAALAYPAGMGMGDVKLAAVMGLFLGRAVGPAMLVALVAGSVVGALIIARRAPRKVARPPSRSVPTSPSAALWACSRATRSSTGTWRPSSPKGLSAACR